MEIFIASVTKIADYTVVPIARQVGYLYFHKSNLDELKTQIQILEYARERLHHSVDKAIRKGEEIEADVQNWLMEVDNITKEVYDFLIYEGQVNKKCFSGTFPNLAMQYRLSRKAKKMTQRVCDMGGQRFDHPVSHIPNILQQAIQNYGYEEFETRTQILKHIMEALRDPNFHIIGVWGMAGVGKTMLVKEVGKQAVGENLFSEMVFTCVSQTQNIKKIQQDIGEKLNINWRGESVSERANQLRLRLRKEYKILVILDDVWHKLDLEEVGLSFGDDQKACKILVTSRSYNVLDSTASNFQIGVIMENEAMSLFSKIVGAQVDNQNFKQLATQIVKHCGGLPMAITTVARALKNRSFQHWREALQRLRMSNPTNIEGTHQKVYSSIKLIYDFLESEEARSLLLLCSLFETISIEQLSNYVIGLNLFDGIDKLEEIRDKTIMLVHYLMDHCLLLDSEQGDGFVELHCVVRDVILSIASKTEQMYYFTNAAEFEEYLYKETFKGSTAISLYNIKIDKYPETFECPELKLLRLKERNSDSLQIPDCFFKGLSTLYVLDLDGVHLEPLPSSFCLLQNLQTLQLVNCTLGDVTSVGELKNLQILNLSYSSIEELPSQIGQLRRLQYLNLQYCRHLKVIQPNVISSLIHLKELNLEQSFTNWEAEGVLDGDERRNSNLGEVRNLPHLTNLRLNVLNVNILPKDMFSEKLEKYKIVIGTELPSYLVKNNSSRLLMLKLDPNSQLKEHDFEGLLKKSEDLHLIGLESVKNVAYELDSNGFPELKHLRLQDSTEIRRIINSIGNILSRPPALPNLETLHLEGLRNLEKIIHGSLKAESFGKLRDINVKNCGKLKSLFSLYIARKLERITVEDCMMMEEILSHGREGDVLDDNNESLKQIKTCQLHSLRLEKLPKLVLFCLKFITPENVEEERIDDSAMPLFNGKVVFPKLESLELYSLKFQKFWNLQPPSSCGFESLKRLIVVGCDNLKGLIPPSMIGNLQSIRVEKCKAMEYVVYFTENSGAEGKKMEEITFPKLESLELRDLPNLEWFSASDCLDCSSLLKLEIIECPKLKTLIRNSMPTSNIEPGGLVESVDEQPLFSQRESVSGCTKKPPKREDYEHRPQPSWSERTIGETSPAEASSKANQTPELRDNPSMKVILRLDLHNKAWKEMVYKKVSNLSGIDKVDADMKEDKLIVFGRVNGENLVMKLIKYNVFAEVISMDPQ